MKIETCTIPTGWANNLLDEVAKRGSGHTPDKDIPMYWHGGIKWISLRDSYKLDRIYISETEEEISQEGIKNSSAVLHPVGVVVLSRDAGVGKSAITTQEMAVSQHFIAWKCGPRLNNHYLYYWLQSMKPEFERVAVGSTIKTIGLPYFKRLHIAYPTSMNEQLKIVEVLISWDRAIDLTTQLIAAKQQYKRGLMQQLLTGKRKFASTRGWSWRKIGDLFHSTTRFESWDDEKIYIQAIVRRWSQGIEVRPPLLGKQIKTKNLQVIRTGDFLISDIQASYGAMSIVGDKQDGLYASNVYTILVPRDEKQIHTSYFDQLSRTSLMRHLVAQSSNGFKAERIRLGFVLKTFMEQKVYLPDDIDEQKRIADVLQLCDDEITLLNRKLELLKKQKQGLMQQLLTGKVRVKV